MRIPTITQDLSLYHAHQRPKRRIVERFYKKRIRQIRRELFRLKVKQALFARTEARLP